MIGAVLPMITNQSQRASGQEETGATDRKVEEDQGDGSVETTTAPIDSVTFLGFLNIFLRRWKVMVGIPMIAAMLAIAVALILPVQYRAVTSFIPENRMSASQVPSGLAGLASQLGMSTPTGMGQSGQFYASVLESRTVRSQVLMSKYDDPRTDQRDSVLLLELLEIEGETESEQLNAGLERLSDMLNIDVDVTTQIVTLGADSPYPVLSAAIANKIVQNLDRFNVEARHTNVRARRAFTEGRVAEAELELGVAEDNLLAFLEQNRRYQSAPQLVAEYERLQRQVSLKQEILLTLRRQLEEARIQEVDDTPMITVIDSAVAPTEKSQPQRRVIVLVGGFLGVLIAIAVVLGSQILSWSRERDMDEYRAFRNLSRSMWDDLRGLGWLRKGSNR